MQVQEATGASIRKADLLKTKEYLITDFGAVSGGSPVENTKAINTAISAASESGGTVIVPEGEFKVYTIILKSHVNLRLEKHAFLRAARTTIQHSYETQVGEGGNYEEPEVNLYAGLQDHGHSYFANSLLYAKDQEDIMIYGEGVILGSYEDEESGFLRYTLMGGDPLEPVYRNEKGHQGEWFGNKGIALVRCKNIVLADFSFVIGGHFAIIAEGVTNLYAEHLLIDTTRDAFDLDCCQDVTVVHSTFNSLTDDALVIKASYGAGIFMPSKNILIEDCKVCGYDAGSVYAGVYSRHKLIATDSCGPTGRVKLGTESTCGYEKVTVRRVSFDRSRGFALEAVDGADLTNIIFEDCVMDNVSSSPIFIRAGERGRFPVSGNSSEPLLVADEHNVRLDNRNWVLPNTADYQSYPPKRYTPSYRKDEQVCIDGLHSFPIVNQQQPAKINSVNLTDKTCSEPNEQYQYANACGSEHIARVSHILIRNITVTNADPRYPILLMGLTDSKLSHISLEHICVTYRGGITMEQATEQRQLYTNWEYTQYKTASSVQALPWLVNPFFLKEEGLLPRVDWNRSTKSWQADPYNVPELPNVYPEPSNWGILPAYGIYARHVEHLTLSNVALRTLTYDERHAVVFDDVQHARIQQLYAMPSQLAMPIALVEQHYKRPTNLEYLPNEPYVTTTVSNISIEEDAFPSQKKSTLYSDAELTLLTPSDICNIIVDAPAPGTPRDDLYTEPTLPIPQNGYHYAIETAQYPLPLTVYRPFLNIGRTVISKGTILRLPIKVYDPASQVSAKESENHIYQEKKEGMVYSHSAIERELIVTLESSYAGASYDREQSVFIWDSSQVETGRYQVTFSLDDHIIKETTAFEVEVI